MDQIITSDQLSTIFGVTPMAVLNVYLGPLNIMLPRYNITTPKQIAMFLAQTGHESGGYKSERITENLNYKSSVLNSMFKSRMTVTEANQFGRNDMIGQKANQEAIANIIYGRVWGLKNLGNTQPGDGWLFRGRGLIQLTGRANYQAFATDMGMSIDQAISYLETAMGATEASAWFWHTHDLNHFADNDDIVGCTRVINPGLLGLAERTKLYHEALAVLTN